MAPINDDTPAKCILNIAKSTPFVSNKDKGGYTVQPVPTPNFTAPNNNKNNAGGNNQKLKLFNLGKDISGAPISIGTNQLPKPPIKAGITIKKIIIKA
jgi:hypothetical protein